MNNKYIVSFGNAFDEFTTAQAYAEREADGDDYHIVKLEPVDA